MTLPHIEVEPELEAGGLPERRHVLDLDDYSPEELAATLDLAHGMAEVLGRDIKKTPALRGRVIVTLFYEASTRTRISFEEAGKILSADVINMSASGSSTDKGESLLNTGLTLQAMGVDTLVVRHPHSGAPNFLARNLERVSVVNAGDGMHAHPTQALLDLYTVQSKLGGISGPQSRHSRRRPAQQGGAFRHLGLRQDGRSGGAERPANPYSSRPAGFRLQRNQQRQQARRPGSSCGSGH